MTGGAARGGWWAHPTAVVDEGAVVGAGTRIWHFSHVAQESRVGRGCTLGQNVYVAPRAVLGDGVKVQNNVSLYEGVVLEDEVFCGPGAVFTNVRTPRAGVPRNSAEHFAATRVRRGASIGANATVVCGCTIGAWALVAAGAVVTRDVPDFALVAGVPARKMGWVCACGVRLDLEGDAARCAECGRRYRLQDGALRREADAVDAADPVDAVAQDDSRAGAGTGTFDPSHA